MPCIALFDSGVGGLTVLNAIQQHIPDAQVVYFADHQASPYGGKEPGWLQARIVKLVSQLDREHTPDVIIIACNTASTLSLNALRACIKTPIIGVVPAVKTAAERTMAQAIGVLATPTTINSHYLNNLINDFALTCHVTKVASTELVAMAEKKLSQQTIELDKLNDIITPFIQNKCDVVVLGCTHFPHLIEELNELAPNINWIDSGEAIARRCTSVLSGRAPKPLPSIKENSSSYMFYSTSHIDAGLKQTIASLGFKHIHSITTTYD